MARITGKGHGGSSGSSYNLYLDYNLVSQNIEKNESVVSVRFWAQAGNPRITAWKGSPQPWSVSAGGLSKSGAMNIDFRNQRVMDFGTHQFTIGHDADGTKTISIGGSFTISGVNSITGGNVSGSWALPTIPRASKPSLSANIVDIGGSVTVYTNSKSNSFTHDIYYILGSRQARFANRVYTSEILELTALEAWAEQVPNGDTRAGIIRMRTYNGNTLVGSNDIALTTRVPKTYEYNPTSTSLYTSINGTGTDKTFGAYVQGMSKVNVRFTGEPGLGAKVKSKTIEIDGKKYSSDDMISDVLTKSGDIPIKVTITDSRNRTSSQSTTIKVHQYAPPKIEEFLVDRVPRTTQAKVKRKGSWDTVAGANKLTVRVEKRIPGVASWDYVTQNSLTDTGIFDMETYATGVIETSSYEWRLILTDTLGSKTESLVIIGTAAVALSFGKLGSAIGKVYEDRHTLEVGGDAGINGQIKGYSDIDIDGDSLVRGDSSVIGRTSLLGSLDVSGDIKLNGVPLMAEIHESGKNSNGFFIKFTDGTMICKHYFAQGSVAFASSGNGFQSGVILWNYPAQFTNDRPFVVVNDNITSQSVWAIPYTVGADGYSFTLGSFINHAARARQFSVGAIGRWK